LIDCEAEVTDRRIIMDIITSELKKELDTCKTQEDLFGKNGLMKRVIKNMVEYMLKGEMEDHLGYTKYDKKGKNTGNNRNGVKSKNVRSNYGDISISIPQDRESEFEPQIIKKYQKDITFFDDKIISMYAKGMSTRDITEHIKNLYGVELSATFISNVTDKIIERAKEWQARPLDKVYAAVFFDAIHYNVKVDGHIVNKAAYTALGINLEGKKNILGIWVGENEGAHYWAGIANELKNRGVEDILISCMDGLKGLPKAIKAVFPNTEIQLCIIHLIRNSFKFIPHKYAKTFTADLKKIYKAPSQESAQFQLENLIQIWDKKYPLAVKPWVDNWENIVTFLKYPPDLRSIIYTTNAVESLHRQFRKVTKAKSIFPTDQALLKMLFLAQLSISKKWTQPIRAWKTILSQLSIFFEGRLIFNH
jgi:transposase-like protein